MTIASVESPAANNSIFWVGVPVGVQPGITAVVSVNPQSEDGWRILPAKTPAIDHEWQHFAFVMRVNAFNVVGEPLENVFILYINGHAEQDLPLGAGLLNLPNVSPIFDPSLMTVFNKPCFSASSVHWEEVGKEQEDGLF